MATAIDTHQELELSETANLKAFAGSRGLEVVGIANLELQEGMPAGIDSDASCFLEKYRCAVVLGDQLGNLKKGASGSEI